MLNNLRDNIRQYFTRVKPLAPGTHRYQAPPDAEHPYRLHLRLEPDGSGLLIIDAHTILHLNPTAAEFAYHLVKDTPPEEAARLIASRYRVSREQALQDYQNLVDRIQTLIHTPDLDPVTFLDFERRDPYTTELSAPYRLDCALTYRLPEGEDPNAAPNDRVKPELSTQEWKTILDKAWSVGIPHVVFTGGEPTLREDLIELIAHTQEIGQVSGLLTDGPRLTDPAYLQSLLQSGLDHVMLVLHPEKEASWEALKALLGVNIFTTVHLTITPGTAGEMDAYLNRLVEMGAKNLSLSASDVALATELAEVRKHAAEHLLSLMWDLPVPYSDIHPVAFEKNESAPDGAGIAWLYIEPDGDVLPAQGVYRVLGNFLTDPWEKIWNQPRGRGVIQ